MKEKKKILVIGGTGTISTPITRRLAEDETVQLYMFNRGRRKDDFGENVIRMTGDIHDIEASEKLLEGLSFDSVIHFILYRPNEAEDMYRLFAGRTKQFIFISTNCALDHETGCLVDESVPLGNRYSAYGMGKAECERYFTERFREDHFPVTIVRPTQTYSEGRIPLSVKSGPYWPVISRILRGKEVIVHGDGESIWAGTHAEDFAENFMPLIMNEKAIGEAFLIANPEPYTWNSLYRALGEALGCEVKIVHIPTELLALSRKYRFDESIRGDKYYSNLFSTEKLKRVTGKADYKIPMKDGIRMYLEWMDSHPEAKTEDAEFDEWCDNVIVNYRLLAEAFGKEA